MQLSVIIVNFNGMQYLDACFNSLYSMLCNISYEIIVIDNNSSDESCVFIKENHPKVILIESKVNYGFGNGNNEAVKLAKGDKLLLLNNDTILLDKLDEVLNVLEKDKSIGALTIQMLDGSKKYATSFGNFPNIYNMFWLAKLQHLELDLVTGIFNSNRYEVDWLSGSFILLKRDIYLRIGGFDQDYFMYVEDVDFSKKIEKIGLKRVFLPNYKYIHFIGFNKSKNPLLIQGFSIFINKHHNGIYKYALLFALQINRLIKKIKR